jgi:hypothetical protein
MVYKKKKREIFDPDSIEIEDPENYMGEPDLKYSQELLVMEQVRRYSKAASQEMKKGWEERKIDKFGMASSIKTHPDTRKELAACVNTLKNLLVGFLREDKQSFDAVEALYKELEELKAKYIEMEQEAWEKIPNNIKHPSSNWVDRWEHIDNALNFDYIYGEKYLQQTIPIYRRLFEELYFLIHKMGYFKALS